MNLLSWIPGIFKGGKEVVEVFKENKEKKGQRSHEENMADIGRDLASLKQFSAEFHARENRTWWDSFIDGLNRLPRPLLTILVIGLFVYAPLNPEKFLLIAKAYEVMPEGYWVLLSVIIGFYFGGRMQLKSQDFVVKKNAVNAAKELVEMRKEFRKLDDSTETVEARIFENATSASGDKPVNSVIADWLEKKRKDPAREQK